MLMKTKLILLNFLFVPIFLSFGQFSWNSWIAGSTSGTISTGSCTANVAITQSDNTQTFADGSPKYNPNGTWGNGNGLSIHHDWTGVDKSTTVTINFNTAVNNPCFQIDDINTQRLCYVGCSSNWSDEVIVTGTRTFGTGTITVSSDAAILSDNFNVSYSGAGNTTATVSAKPNCDPFNRFVQFCLSGTFTQIRITYKSGPWFSRPTGSSFIGSANCNANSTLCRNESTVNCSITDADPDKQYIKIGSISSTNCFTAMPVEFAYFNYQCTDQTQLVWETNSERNNDYFMVYESSDGVNFEPIRQIDGVGNSLTPTQYQTPVFGSRLQTMYYKLEQVDFDGTTTELATLSIPANCQSSDELYVVGPNPFKNELTIEHHNQEHSQLSIINAEGKLIYESTLEETKNQHFIPTDSWSKGVYVVRIQSKTKIENFRIIKD